MVIPTLKGIPKPTNFNTWDNNAITEIFYNNNNVLWNLFM